MRYRSELVGLLTVIALRGRPRRRFARLRSAHRASKAFISTPRQRRPVKATNYRQIPVDPLTGTTTKETSKTPKGMMKDGTKNRSSAIRGVVDLEIDARDSSFLEFFYLSLF